MGAVHMIKSNRSESGCLKLVLVAAYNEKDGSRNTEQSLQKHIQKI